MITKVWVALDWPTGVLANVVAVFGAIDSDAYATQTPLLPSHTRPPAQMAPTPVQVRHTPGVALHWVLWHADDVCVVQSPSVLQTDAVVSAPLLQLAGTHETLAPGYTHCV